MICRLTFTLRPPPHCIIERKQFPYLCLENNLMKLQVNLSQRSTYSRSLVYFFRAQQHHRSDRVHLCSTERHLPQERRGQEVALLLRLVLLLWRPVLHPGRDGGRPRRQHLHREEQGAALPLSHRPLQEHHARHAATAQLPIQTALSLQLTLHRPAALAGDLTHRRLQDLQPAALCSTLLRGYSSQPAPHQQQRKRRRRRHLHVHPVEGLQAGQPGRRRPTPLWHGGPGHPVPAPQLLPERFHRQWRWRRRRRRRRKWKWRRRSGDKQRYAPVSLQVQLGSSSGCSPEFSTAEHLHSSRHSGPDGSDIHSHHGEGEGQGPGPGQRGNPGPTHRQKGQG